LFQLGVMPSQSGTYSLQLDGLVETRHRADKPVKR
jgi:hypothetical protein